jgi:hypothetical protein
MGCRPFLRESDARLEPLGAMLSRRSASVKNADKSGAPAPDYFDYTENELPQPQLPVAFGLLNVNPDPITEFT